MPIGVRTDARPAFARRAPALARASSCDAVASVTRTALARTDRIHPPRQTRVDFLVVGPQVVVRNRPIRAHAFGRVSPKICRMKSRRNSQPDERSAAHATPASERWHPCPCKRAARPHDLRRIRFSVLQIVSRIKSLACFEYDDREATLSQFPGHDTAAGTGANDQHIWRFSSYHVVRLVETVAFISVPVYLNRLLVPIHSHRRAIGKSLPSDSEAVTSGAPACSRANGRSDSCANTDAHDTEIRIKQTLAFIG